MRYVVLALNCVVYWNIFMVIMAMESYTWILNRIILCSIIDGKVKLIDYDNAVEGNAGLTVESGSPLVCCTGTV